MKRDTIYYQLFKRFPSLLFSLVPEPPPEAENYRFDSVEVKETCFRIDGVFLPPETAIDKTVYFAEVQFQKDDALYHRFFTESFTYLYRNQALYDDWYGVILFPSRTLEPADLTMHRALLNSDQVQRIYLDELGELTQQPIGIRLMQLTLASETEMMEQARRLIDRVKQEPVTPFEKNEIIEVITTIAVYKFSNLSREEVEAMLGQRLEETRFYQEVKAEGRVEREAEMLKLTIPLLLEAGMSLEQIAQRLKVDLAAVQQAAQQ
jgi:predicted transposase/invertase (TIGR01784 family)